VPWSFIIPVAGSILSNVIGGNSSGDAAQAQIDAANQASQVEQKQFNTTQQNLAPWVTGGQMSLAELQRLMGIGPGAGTQGYGQLAAPFQYDPNSPQLQFQTQQGVNAIQNAATPSGSPIGGNTLKALTQFGQGLGTQDYQTQFNDWLAQNSWTQNLFGGLANAGQNAAAQTGTFGANAATQIGGNTIGAGNAQAAGIMGQGNALSGIVNSLTGSSQMNNWLATLLSGGGGGTGGFGGAGPAYSP
jgi:hypothetical protein